MIIIIVLFFAGHFIIVVGITLMLRPYRLSSAAESGETLTNTVNGVDVAAMGGFTVEYMAPLAFLGLIDALQLTPLTKRVGLALPYITKLTVSRFLVKHADSTLEPFTSSTECIAQMQY